MRPAVPSGYARVVERDVRLSNGLVLPRGAIITGHNLATLNSPAFWEQPERFMPVGLPGLLLLWLGWHCEFPQLCGMSPASSAAHHLHVQPAPLLSPSRFRLVQQPGHSCSGAAWVPTS